MRRIEAALEFSRTEFQRAQTLARTRHDLGQALDKAKFESKPTKPRWRARRRSWKSGATNAPARRRGSPIRQRRRERTRPAASSSAPVSGRVLKIKQESEAVVRPGAPLVEIGDPRDLEVVADLLSTDAVRSQGGRRCGSTAGAARRSAGPGHTRRTGGFHQGLGARHRGAAGPP